MGFGLSIGLSLFPRISATSFDVATLAASRPAAGEFSSLPVPATPSRATTPLQNNAAVRLQTNALPVNSSADLLQEDLRDLVGLAQGQHWVELESRLNSFSLSALRSVSPEQRLSLALQLVSLASAVRDHLQEKKEELLVDLPHRDAFQPRIRDLRERMGKLYQVIQSTNATVSDSDFADVVRTRLPHASAAQKGMLEVALRGRFRGMINSSTLLSASSGAVQRGNDLDLRAQIVSAILVSPAADRDHHQSLNLRNSSAPQSAPDVYRLPERAHQEEILRAMIGITMRRAGNGEKISEVLKGFGIDLVRDFGIRPGVIAALDDLSMTREALIHILYQGAEDLQNNHTRCWQEQDGRAQALLYVLQHSSQTPNNFENRGTQAEGRVNTGMEIDAQIDHLSNPIHLLTLAGSMTAAGLATRVFSKLIVEHFITSTLVDLGVFSVAHEFLTTGEVTREGFGESLRNGLPYTVIPRITGGLIRPRQFGAATGMAQFVTGGILNGALHPVTHSDQNNGDLGQLLVLGMLTEGTARASGAMAHGAQSMASDYFPRSFGRAVVLAALLGLGSIAYEHPSQFFQAMGFALPTVGLMVGGARPNEEEIPEGFVRIPAGTFVMGDPEALALSNAYPERQITISRDFYLQARPVTVREYREYVNAMRDLDLSLGLFIHLESGRTHFAGFGRARPRGWLAVHEPMQPWRQSPEDLADRIHALYEADRLGNRQDFEHHAGELRDMLAQGEGLFLVDGIRSFLQLQPPELMSILEVAPIVPKNWEYNLEVGSNIQGLSPRLGNQFTTRNYWHHEPETGFNDPDHPAVMVNWFEAESYIRWRYGMRARLPTEAEWEYAARGGQQNAYGTSTGDLNRELAHYGTLCTASVYSDRPPNPFGLYDMTGNVNEWTGSWYGSNYYRDMPSIDPIGPVRSAAISKRGRRGGSWIMNLMLDTSSRGSDIPSERNYGLGFRVLFAPQD